MISSTSSLCGFCQTQFCADFTGKKKKKKKKKPQDHTNGIHSSGTRIIDDVAASWAGTDSSLATGGAAMPGRAHKRSRSPPRPRHVGAAARHDSDSDASVPRRGAASSPRASRRRHDSDIDASPGARPRADSGGSSSDSDASVQRAPPATATLDGQGAAVVHRDAQGRVIDHAAEAERRFAEMKRTVAHEERLKREWNTGAADMQRAADRAAYVEHEAAKGVTRYADDADLQEHLKARVRADDPMLQVAQRAAAAAGVRLEAAAAPASRGGKPLYKGPPPPPNRFNIPPGYRWDGVDRGNGWERRVLLAAAAAQDNSTSAYRARTADM